MYNKVSSYFSKLNTLSLSATSAIVYLNGRNRVNFKVNREFPFINAVGVNTNVFKLYEIAKNSAVRYIVPSVSVHTEISSGANNNIELEKIVNASGQDVNIAFLDTGINKHLDFCMPHNRLIEFKDFVNGVDDFYDDHGHGTFVAGVATGAGITSGKRYSGVATKANAIGVKVIDGNGEGNCFDVLDGMQWVIDNYKRLNIKVCCMSFGANVLDGDDPLKRGVEQLVRQGITVVVASGNDGKGILKTPAISPYVISVGAVDNMGRIADFTSRGIILGRRVPDVFAKGVDVVSCGNQTYTTMSGTSVSAPYVAGLCACILEKYRDATPKKVKEILYSMSKRGANDERLLL